MNRLKINPASTALVVIDMQNDFCAQEGFYGKTGRDISALQDVVAPIAKTVSRAREAGLTIVFTRLVHDEKNGPMEARHDLKPKTWTTSGDRLMPGTWGVEVMDALAPLPGEIVVDKPGYSAFHATSLELQLHAMGIKTLIFTGVTTYACVLASASAAFDRDFDVIMLTDLVASWKPELDQATFQIVDLLLGHAVPSSALIFEPTPTATP